MPFILVGRIAVTVVVRGAIQLARATGLLGKSVRVGAAASARTATRGIGRDLVRRGTLKLGTSSRRFREVRKTDFFVRIVDILVPDFLVRLLPGDEEEIVIPIGQTLIQRSGQRLGASIERVLQKELDDAHKGMEDRIAKMIVWG